MPKEKKSEKKKKKANAIRQAVGTSREWEHAADCRALGNEWKAEQWRQCCNGHV